MSISRYEKLTGPEIDKIAKENRVVIIPVGTLEEHGPHLPIDTDLMITKELCLRTAKLVPDEVVLFPPVIHGFSPHHLDFPGPITIEWSTFVKYLLDITKSLSQHGFNRILFINSHGSNAPLIEMAARLTTLEFDQVLCCAVTWWNLSSVQEIGKELRDSTWPGGMNHGCEMETSIYMAVQPEMVQMDKAVRDINFPQSPHFWKDLIQSFQQTSGYKNPVVFMEHWSTQSDTGAQGDPTVATPEKGEMVLAAATKEFAEIIVEMRKRPTRKRIDHHSKKLYK